MWGKKKEKKQNIKTYIDGEEQELEIPKPAESSALEPEQVPVQEPTTQPVQEFDGECILCFDFRWYADQLGVWHCCPRCNPKGNYNTPEKQKVSLDNEEDKPRKGNLYEIRICKECRAQNEVHKRRKKWECEACGVIQ